jgi:hypothetical protein
MVFALSYCDSFLYSSFISKQIYGKTDECDTFNATNLSVYPLFCAKTTIRVMYGLFEAPFNVDWSTFPVEVAQPYPTVQIEKWMQDNQIDLKAGIWSDSTQLS